MSPILTRPVLYGTTYSLPEMMDVNAVQNLVAFPGTICYSAGYGNRGKEI